MAYGKNGRHGARAMSRVAEERAGGHVIVKDHFMAELNVPATTCPRKLATLTNVQVGFFYLKNMDINFIA